MDEFEERREALFDKVRADIDRVGWSSISVFPSEDGGTRFTYSIGFTEIEQPELIVYGLPGERAHALLAAAYHLVTVENVRFEPGGRYSGLVEGYEIEARAVARVDLTVSQSIYEGIEVVQLVWPDQEGRFPGEEDCDWQVDFLQAGPTCDS